LRIDSWKNHNGTRHGFDDGWVHGEYGNALEFDGVDDYVEVPHCNDLDVSSQSPTPASSITIFARLNVSSNGTVVGKTDGTKTNYLLHVQKNQLCFNFTSNGVDKSINASIEFNKNVTVAVTYNQTDLVLYINGSVSASRPQNATLDSCTSPVIIGALNQGSCHIKMVLDELWIYSRSLKPTEIQELHQKNYVTFPGAYRRACALDSTVFPDSPEYISGLYLFDLKINETRIFDELQNEPLVPAPEEDDYWDIHDDYITFSRYIHVKPEWGIYAWYNITVRRGWSYAEIRSAIVNEGSSKVNMSYVSYGFGAFSDLIYPLYDPFYVHIRLTNGTSYEKTCETFSEKDYYVWRRDPGVPSPTGGSVKYVGVTGNRSLPDEINPGLMIECLNTSLTYEVDYSLSFEKGIRIVYSDYQEIPAGGQTGVYMFRVVPMRRYQRSAYEHIFDNIMPNLDSLENVDIAMPASYGLVVYGLALYYQQTGNLTARNMAKEAWSFYYTDIQKRYPKVYGRSLISLAVAGLLLDESNQTYLSFATDVAGLLMQQQDEDENSPSRGRIMGFALDEQGWASILLGKLWEITGNTTYHQKRELLHSALKRSAAYNDLTVFMLNANGEKDSVNCFAETSTDIFRAGELVYGVLYDNEESWRDPAVLASISLFFRMSTLNFYGRPGTAIECGNTETHSVCLAALYRWWKATQDAIGVYVKWCNASLVEASFTSNRLRLVLTAPASQKSVTEIYCGDKGKPNEVSVNGVPKTDMWSYNSDNRTLAININHESSMEVIINWGRPISSPDILFKPLPVDLGDIYTGTKVNFTVYVEYDSYKVTVNEVEFVDNPEWFKVHTLLPSEFNREIGRLKDNASINVELKVPSEPGTYTVQFAVHGTSPYGQEIISGSHLSFTAVQKTGIIPPLPSIEETIEAIKRALGDPHILILLAVMVAVLSYYSLRRR